MCLFVKITKRRRAENARFEPGNWDSYRAGRSDNAMSLPVDYVMVGFIITPPAIGKSCMLLRVERNGVPVLGIFQSTVVQEVFNGGFVTQNSVYMVEPVDLIAYLESRP